MMTKAYSFIRFSTPAQMKGDSLRRQLAKSERYAEEHNLDLDTSMRALGVSAFKGEHRRKGPLAVFLNKIITGEIARGSYLIVENIDRLSRENPWDALGMFREIIEAGITVVSLSDDMVYSRETLTRRPESLNTLQSALIKANRESVDKSERLQEVWNAKRDEIIAGSRRKFTRQGPGWFVLVPDDPREPLVGDWHFSEKADVVRAAFAQCIAGAGKERVAKTLNDGAVPCFKHGDGWSGSTVLTLLTDRRVIGELQFYTKVDGVRRAHGCGRGRSPHAVEARLSAHRGCGLRASPPTFRRLASTWRRSLRSCLVQRWR